MIRDRASRDAICFLRGSAAATAVHTRLSGGGGRSRTASREKRKRKSLRTDVCWWMVYSVWLWTYMNKHIGPVLAAWTSNANLWIVSNWKSVIWLWLQLWGGFNYGRIINRTMDFSFPTENKLNDTSDRPSFPLLESTFVNQMFGSLNKTEYVWNV